MHILNIFLKLKFCLAASTDVERAFSKGGLTVSKRRHALSDESVRASTVLGSWAAHGLLPEPEILRMLEKKIKHAKKTETVSVVEDSGGVGVEIISD